MRGAPSVSVPVGRSRLGLYLVAFLVGLGALTWLFWVLASPAPGRQALVAALGLACGLCAWRGQRRPMAGVLHWSGHHWFLWAVQPTGAQRQDPAAAGEAMPGVEVDVVATLDLQSILLLRVSVIDGGPVSWLWLTPGEDAAHWQAVRRAVHGPRPVTDDDAGLAPLP